jgi:hypothetical protein
MAGGEWKLIVAVPRFTAKAVRALSSFTLHRYKTFIRRNAAGADFPGAGIRTIVALGKGSELKCLSSRISRQYNGQ